MMPRAKSSKSSRQGVILAAVSLVLLLIGISAIFLVLAKQTQCSSGIRADSKGRKVLETNINYEHLWDYRSSFIGAIGIIDRITIFSNGDCHRVVALDVDTGDTAWTFSYGIPDRISVDPIHEHIYVSIVGNNELVALSKDGEQIWLNDTIKWQRGGIAPYTLVDGRLIAFISTNRLVKVDPDTGEFGEDLPLPDFLDTVESNSFWRIGKGQLIASGVEDATVKWVSAYQGLLQCHLEQVAVSSELILLNCAINIVALDKETGALIWQSPEDDIVSNFAVQEGRILFLDIDAQLHILEEKSGKPLAEIQFAPPSKAARDISKSGGSIGSSMLVATGDVVAIYFGDTDILSAYRLIFENTPVPPKKLYR